MLDHRVSLSNMLVKTFQFKSLALMPRLMAIGGGSEQKASKLCSGAFKGGSSATLL